MKKKFFHNFGPLFGIFLFAVAIWVLHHELREYHYHDVVRHLAEIPAHRLLLSLACTVLNYLIMTGYDTLALRYIRHPITYGKIALASFIGYAWGTAALSTLLLPEGINLQRTPHFRLVCRHCHCFDRIGLAGNICI